MKINWFGRYYYKVQGSEYKRNFWIALMCFLEWDIVDKITGKHWHIIDGKWVKHYRHYNFESIKKFLSGKK